MLRDSFYKVFSQLEKDCFLFKIDNSMTNQIEFMGKILGSWSYREPLEQKLMNEVTSSLQTILYTSSFNIDSHGLHDWLYNIKSLSHELFDWVGIYFKESYLCGKKSSDLILGPYIGSATEHTRIPIEKGLCGLALREEKIINMDDVTKDPRHIACSLTTRSELIIPLSDQNGNFIAELDIDSNTPNAFSLEVEELVKNQTKTFQQFLKSC